MSLLARRCLQRSRLVDELVEAWQLDHKDAMFACDVGEICWEAIDLCRLFGDAWKRLANDLLSGRLVTAEETGRMFQVAIKRSVGVVANTIKLVARAEAKGYPIKGAEELRKGFEEIKDIDSRVDRHWPFVDREMVMAARTDFERGEHVSTEEFLDGVSSVAQSVQHQNRVA